MDISIIIPNYNRKDSLRQCLESFFNQDYPQENFEIIVVDDGSSDGTEQMLKELSKERPNLRYFSQSHKGPAAARNLGIKYAKADIIGFTDNDCILKSDWIRKMVSAHRLEDGVMATGGLTRVNPYNIKAVVSQSLSDGAIKTTINGKSEIIFFPTCNVSFKKNYLNGEEFNELFPLPAGEDLEFSWRLYKKGNRFLHRQDIEIFHNCHPNFKSFLRQAYMYGRGNFLVQHIHKGHPLLKELKTGKISFWVATLINIIKIPRFSYLLGKRLIKGNNIKKIYKKLSIYSYFFLHKIFYILGNIFEFFRLRKINKEKKAFYTPRLLILDITHSCNLSCRICDIWNTASNEKDLDISYIKKMLYEAKGLGIEEIALSGGEPLLRKDIFEIFEYTRKLGIKHLGVLTNGILLEDCIEKTKSYLIDNTISPVISLDSLKCEIHNYIRNSDIAWQRSVGSLKLLSSLKKKYPQINFNVITIILDQNLEELLDLTYFIKSLEANSLQFQNLLSNNLKMAERKKSAFWISGSRLSILDDKIDKLIKFKEENPQFIRNSVNNLSLTKKYFRGAVNSNNIECKSVYKTVLISNRGEATTCFSSYGDTKKEHLKRILQSNKALKAQEEVKRCPSPCLLPCFCD